MITLFDEEEIIRSYIQSERYEAIKEKAIFMLKNGKITTDEISECFPELSENDIKEIKVKAMQLV